MPTMPKFGKLPRPPRIRSRVAVAPRGPREFHLGVKPEIGFNQFINPPDFFTTDPHVSKTEWMCYLALAILTGFPKDPYKPPYVGGPPRWVYQKAEQGGRVPGGSVSDFVVLNEQGTASIGIRVETERFHIWTDGAQQQKDLYINAHLHTVNKIVRVWDQHFVDDESGEKVCAVMALALRGIELPSPIFFGTAQRVRP
jgi:hypothetical protein